MRKHDRELVPVLVALLRDEQLAGTAVDLLVGAGTELALRQVFDAVIFTNETWPTKTNLTERVLLGAGMTRGAQLSVLLFELVERVLFDSPAVPERSRLMALAVLGSLVHVAKQCPEAAVKAKADAAVTAMIDILRDASNPRLQARVIGALGNAGRPDTLDDLVPHMYSNHGPEFRVNALRTLRRMPREDERVERARGHVQDVFLEASNAEPVRLAAFRALMSTEPTTEEMKTMVRGSLSSGSSTISRVVRQHLRHVLRYDASTARTRVARDLLEWLKDASVVDFSGTNLTQLSLRLGFEKEDEYFLLGDDDWGVSCGYDIEDTASILIPFSGSVKLEVVVDNRAFCNIYAFSNEYNILEAGFKVDGLEWNMQWWRRRRALATASPDKVLSTGPKRQL